MTFVHEVTSRVQYAKQCVIVSCETIMQLQQAMRLLAGALAAEGGVVERHDTQLSLPNGSLVRMILCGENHGCSSLVPDALILLPGSNRDELANWCPELLIAMPEIVSCPI